MLVLEAGGRDNWIWFHIPVGYLFAIGNPRSDWCFKTEPEQGLNGRSLNYPRGKVIGGSSAINAMIYMRGQAADYDHWRQLGLDRLGLGRRAALLQAARRSLPRRKRTCTAIGGELAGRRRRACAGICSMRFAPRPNRPASSPIPDFNTGDNEGCCAFHVNQKRGRRWSAAAAFLKPVLNRPNLRLETGCLVEGIVFEGKRAVGVRWRQGNRKLHGALPRRSHPRRRLDRLDADHAAVGRRAGAAACTSTAFRSWLDRPGVGENLQDHLQLRLIYKVDGIKTLNERYHSPLGLPACSPNMRCSGAAR